MRNVTTSRRVFARHRELRVATRQPELMSRLAVSLWLLPDKLADRRRDLHTHWARDHRRRFAPAATVAAAAAAAAAAAVAVAVEQAAHCASLRASARLSACVSVCAASMKRRRRRRELKRQQQKSTTTPTPTIPSLSISSAVVAVRSCNHPPARPELAGPTALARRRPPSRRHMDPLALPPRLLGCRAAGLRRRERSRRQPQGDDVLNSAQISSLIIFALALARSPVRSVSLRGPA